MKKLFATILFGVTILHTNAQQSKEVLFIGNSYTAYNNLPALVENLAISKGNTLTYDSNTPGGHRLMNHAVNSTTLQKIAAVNWDYVVIQGQSQEVAFPDGQLATDVYPYGEILCDSIKSNYECSEAMFYMTWGRENGDQTNCGFFPPFCTYDGMQSRLKLGYTTMANDNDASVAPVGEAWRYIRTNHPTIDLYSPDESHPSIQGSYLAACVFYVSIYREPISGSTFYAGIDPADAAIMQAAADLVVLDSLDNWNIGAYDANADFTFNGSGTTVNFVDASDNAVDYYWNFGDGNTSTDQNPTHNYVSTGTYQVQLVVDNGCTVDTLVQSVDLASLGLNDLSNDFKLIQTSEYIALQENLMISNYEIFSIGGQRISFSKNQHNKIDISGLDHGVYILRMEVLNQIISTRFYKN